MKLSTIMKKKLKTTVYWQLHNTCSRQCAYCPAIVWGGSSIEPIDKFLDIANKIINHYKLLNRSIEWHFNGGEPLEFFDFPALLKLCKDHGGTVKLHTNGGNLWMDWWAIAPYINYLHLTYHHWQNPQLINFIIQVFQKNKKRFRVYVPIRPDHYDEDVRRANELENHFNIRVYKTVLYKDANEKLGLYNYTINQLTLLKGNLWVKRHIKKQPLPYYKIIELIRKRSPKFTGKMCNIGIENINISYDGWVSGSSCKTLPLGNIWHGTLNLPNESTKCIRDVCMHKKDRLITKFDV